MNSTYKPWGYTLTLDLYEVDHKQVVEKDLVESFVSGIIQEVQMKAFGPLHCERFGDGHLNGISAMQFIETSSITVHTDEVTNRVFIDIFSCKKFNSTKAINYSLKHFKTKEYRARFEPR